MQILSNEKDSEFNLDTATLHHNPLVLSIPPFMGRITLNFKIYSSRPTKGICYCIHEPHLVYVSNYEDIPKGTYLAIFQDENSYIAFLCLSNSHCNLTATLSEGPTLILMSEKKPQANKAWPVLIALRGDTLDIVLKKLITLSIEKTGNIRKLIEEKRVISPCFEKLGWHSRLAFGEEVTHQNIIQAVRSIRKAGFGLGFVIIEQGWQTVTCTQEGSPSLFSFEADSKKFPQGLKGLITQLHELGIEQVGVWHEITGHKGGIHAGLAKKYDFLPDLFGRYFPGHDLGRTFQFFYDYYAYLKEQGVSFIKIGNQENTSHHCKKERDVTHPYRHLQTAIQGASSLHFHSAQFSTDYLGNGNLFYWTNSFTASKGNDGNSIQAVSSIPSHLTHVFWLKHFMHLDFDAWITEGASNETFAIFHALSGNLNVISDPPGKHNKELLQKSVLSSGTIIKADQPLTLCDESLFINPLNDPKVYKAYTLKGKNGIFALFADPKKTIQDSFSPQEIPGLKGNLFATFSYRHGFLGLIEKSSVFSFKLKNGESDIITLAPVENGIALIGCLTLFLTAGPIVSTNIESDSMQILTAFASSLFLYCERQVLEIRRNGIAIPWSLDTKRHLLSIDPKASFVEETSYVTITFE